jgi:hypothetical protein
MTKPERRSKGPWSVPLGPHAIGAAGKYIALQHHRKAVVLGRIQCCPIRRLPAIKRLADPAHPPRHRKIAHTHFAHVVVHIPAEPIEQTLAEPANRPCFTLQTPQKQHGMQHDHLQSAVNRVRHAVELVKGGGARLCHDRAIETRDAIVPRGAAK